MCLCMHVFVVCRYRTRAECKTLLTNENYNMDSMKNTNTKLRKRKYYTSHTGKKNTRHTIKLKGIESTPLTKREQKTLPFRKSTHLWRLKQIIFDFHLSCLFRILLGKMSRANWTVHVWKAMETKRRMYGILYVCKQACVCMYVFKYYVCIYLCSSWKWWKFHN